MKINCDNILILSRRSSEEKDEKNIVNELVRSETKGSCLLELLILEQINSIERCHL